jgi:hypothetical protein
MIIITLYFRFENNSTKTSNKFEMNFNLLDNVGAIPADEFRHYRGNNICYDLFGNVFHLNGGILRTGVVKQQVSSSAANSELREISVINAQDISSFQYLLINENSSILILWNDVEFGIIENPLVDEPHQLIIIRETTNNNTTTSLQPSLMKLAFYPYDPYTLVVLQHQSELLLYDLRSRIRTTTIRLIKQKQFLSFTFGPAIEWLRFTIFLFTNEQEIFAICPIIPIGCIISTTIIKELIAWIKDYEHISNNEMDIKYCKILKKYLQIQFGVIDFSYQDEEDIEQFIIAKEGKFDSLVDTMSMSLIGGEDDASISLLDYSIPCQGPFQIHRNHSTSSQISSPITDILCSYTNQQDFHYAPPIIVTIRENSFTEILILDYLVSDVYYYYYFICCIILK